MPVADSRAAVLAVAIVHQARIAAERAATVRDPRRARVARRAGDAFGDAREQLERLILADRAVGLADQARRSSLPVPATVTPAERAWVLGWHLLAATARVRRGASANERPVFGEREAARALALTREALCKLGGLVAPDRQAELRDTITPQTLSLNAQLDFFAPTFDSG